MQPLIGITGRLVNDSTWSPQVAGTRLGYVEGVVEAGGLPVVIPPLTDEATLRGLYERLDGILLSGGEDITPSYYQEEPIPEIGTVSRERDASEFPLVRWAIADGKPIMGICRGIQVLNVALGGTLFQDLLVQRPDTLDHEASVKAHRWRMFDHAITIVPDSQLAELLGATAVQVNSLHHQAVKDLGNGLRIVATSPDGIVEAVEGTGEQFVLAVQCHPEELWQASDTRWRNVFRAFVQACVPAAILG